MPHLSPVAHAPAALQDPAFLERTEFTPAFAAKQAKKRRPSQAPAAANFIISKAQPLQHNLAKSKRKNQDLILQRSLDDHYIAENYYKGFSDDSILYEKDGTISKMLQFDYKVHKLIKGNRKSGGK